MHTFQGASGVRPGCDVPFGVGLGQFAESSGEVERRPRREKATPGDRPLRCRAEGRSLNAVARDIAFPEQFSMLQYASPFSMVCRSSPTFS